MASRVKTLLYTCVITKHNFEPTSLKAFQKTSLFFKTKTQRFNINHRSIQQEKGLASTYAENLLLDGKNERNSQFYLSKYDQNDTRSIHNNYKAMKDDSDPSKSLSKRKFFDDDFTVLLYDKLMRRVIAKRFAKQ